MPNAGIHPTLQELTAFRQGKLSEAALAAVAQHLGTCTACRKAVVNRQPDSFLGKVPEGKPGGSSLPPGKSPVLGRETGDLLNPAASPPPSELPPELVNHAKYRIVRELGRGGMGVVYQAVHKVMDRPIAIKVINPSVLSHPDALPRFQGEVRAAARLDHPNIVRALDADQVGNLHLLVMEYVEGKNLDDLVRARGRLPILNACNYVLQAALGLQHAFEQGMVHRDIKPGNLVLTPRGQVKILDFGLARLRDTGVQSGRLTTIDSFMGTPEYVSPEQATDARTADTRADIYSLGCTLFYLLTGRPPFQEETVVKLVLAHIEKEAPLLRQLNSDVPPELSAVVAQMLAKDPGKRLQTPVDVAHALTPVIRPGTTIGAGKGKQTLSMGAAETDTVKKSKPDRIREGAEAEAKQQDESNAPKPKGPTPSSAETLNAGTSTSTRLLEGIRSEGPQPGMSLSCLCPECGYSYEVADELAGKYLSCPECLTRFKASGIHQPSNRQLNTSLSCSCPQCGYSYEVAQELAGKYLSCPECLTRFKAKEVPHPRKRQADEDLDDYDQPRQAPQVQAEGKALRHRLNTRAMIGVVAVGALLLILCCGVVALRMRGNLGGDGATAQRPPGYNLTANAGTKAKTEQGLAGGENLPGKSELLIQFAPGERFENGMELVIDDKPYHFLFFPQQVTVPLDEGSHSIRLNWHGKQVWTEEVVVKAAKQGRSVVRVPELEDPEGRLVLKITPRDNLNGVELFIDGKLMHTFVSSLFGFGQDFALALPSGQHTVMLKKNGIEVYSETVEVKRAREGSSFQQVDLVLTGTVLITNASAIRPDVQAYVSVDNNRSSSKRWPAGTTTIEVTVGVGTHDIQVYTTRSNQAIATFRVQVEPGKRTVVKMNK